VKARQWSLIGGVFSANRSGMNQPNLKLEIQVLNGVAMLGYGWWFIDAKRKF
jgi:hypothetical protein